MTVYIALIILQLLIGFVCACIKEKTIGKKIVLATSVFLLFLVFVLRAPSVGRDISGYKSMYEAFANASFKRFDLFWTEPGYELLELVFSRYLHAPFQLFLAAIYCFSLFSYYRFIRDYSKDPMLSFFIYICFGFFVFDLSAIRNLLGLSIFLFAVPVSQKRNIKSLMVYVLLALIASQIHSSAYIILLLYPLLIIPINKKTIGFYILVPLCLFVFRNAIMSIVLALFKKSAVDSGAAVGGNVIVYFFVILFVLLIWYLFKKQNNNSDSINEFFYDVNLPLRLVYFGSVFTIFTGSNILVRMAQYGVIFIVILLPNAISKLQQKSRIIIKLFLIMSLVLYFYFFKLLVNELDITPYVFIWNY